MTRITSCLLPREPPESTFPGDVPGSRPGQPFDQNYIVSIAWGASRIDLPTLLFDSSQDCLLTRITSVSGGQLQPTLRQLLHRTCWFTGVRRVPPTMGRLASGAPDFAEALRKLCGSFCFIDRLVGCLAGCPGWSATGVFGPLAPPGVLFRFAFEQNLYGLGP